MSRPNNPRARSTQGQRSAVLIPNCPGQEEKGQFRGLRGGIQKRYLQISGASSDPSGQSLSPSHRQPFEIQVIWSLQANCLGLQVLGARGKERKQGCKWQIEANSKALKPPKAPPPPQQQSTPSHSPVPKGAGGCGALLEHCVPVMDEGKDAGGRFYCPPKSPQGCLSSVPLLQPLGSKPLLFSITLV